MTPTCYMSFDRESSHICLYWHKPLTRWRSFSWIDTVDYMIFWHQASRLCSNFRHSHPASVWMGKIEQEFYLFTQCLIFYFHFWWNIILSMLQQLHMHQQYRGIPVWLWDKERLGGAGIFLPMSVASYCHCFREATIMMSFDNDGIRVSISLVYLL